MKKRLLLLALLAVLAVAMVVAVIIANRGPRIEGVWKVTKYYTAGNGGIYQWVHPERILRKLHDGKVLFGK